MAALLAVLLVMSVVARILAAWHSWPSESTHSTTIEAAASTQEFNLAEVQALALFGSRETNAAQTAAAPVSTQLDLGLRGVVIGKDPASSLAFIASKGRQQPYKVGDLLPAGVDATVVRIAADHVVLRHDGIEQSLWLFDGKGASGKNGGVSSAVSGELAAGKALATAMLQVAPQQIRQTAGRLAEIFTVQPAIANARLLGYRVAPGAKIKEFVQLGFRDGDIITSANGIALNDMANLPELYNLMNRPADVSFSLLREGQPVSLQVTLTP